MIEYSKEFLEQLKELCKRYDLIWNSYPEAKGVYEHAVGEFVHDSEYFDTESQNHSAHDLHKIKCAIKAFKSGNIYYVNLAECDDHAFIWAEIATHTGNFVKYNKMKRQTNMFFSKVPDDIDSVLKSMLRGRGGY